MGLFRFLIHHKLFVHYITIIIIIFGIVSFASLQREARPNVNFNRVSVAIAYPGASPSDIEELLIRPIEEKIDEVDGLEEYRSVSYSGAGAISIVIDDEYPDQDEIVDEIRRKISEVKDLPVEATDPIVREIKASTIPVLKMALYGDLPPEQLKSEVNKFQDYLRAFPGVQSVNYTGLTDLQLKILAHPDKLDQHDITLIEIISELKQWAKKRPGGLLESENISADVIVGKEYNSKEALDGFILRSNDAFKSIKLTQVADIEFGLQKSQRKNLFQGKTAVLITVSKKPFADAVTVTEKIKEGIESYRPQLSSKLNMEIFRDESKRVKDRLGTVLNNAVFGLALVLVLLVIFLDWRAATVTTLGIPIALLGGVIIIYLTGNTLNSLVLVGMIIVLGMLVDDAIVVSENIYSYIEEGMSPTKAAVKGVSQMAVPVTASVFTTVFAFFPILFMKEIMGQFLRVIPITVISMLSVSLFEALFILPVHATEIMKRRPKKETFINGIEEFYSKYLKLTFKFKYVVMAIVAFIFMVTFWQGKNLFERFTLFPANGLDGLSVRVELPKNTPVSRTSDAVSDLSGVLLNVSDDTFESISSSIGEVRTGGSSGSQQNASNLASIDVAFISDSSFIDKEKKILKDIREQLKLWSEKTGFKTSLTIDRPGPPVGKPIQYQVASRDMSLGAEVIDKIRKELQKIEGVNSIDSDLDGDTTSYRFEINSLLASTIGMNPVDISQTVFAATTGVVANEVVVDNDKVDLYVGLKDDGTTQPKDLLNIKVSNKTGQPIPLKSFTKIIEEKGASSIQRFNGLRTITIFAEVNESIISGKEANAKMRPFMKSLAKEYPMVSIDTGGGERDRMKALQDTLRLFVLAIILIFMIISLAFQSVLYPFLVLLAIPFGLVGVVWSLTLHDMPLSLMGFIGLVGLSGVVVNVSIIFLKLVQENIRAGMAYDEALISSATRRLRPIMVTTITTLIGLIPLIYGIGGVDTFVQPLALVLGWGLFVSTALNMLALPAIMSCLRFVDKYTKLEAE